MNREQASGAKQRLEAWVIGKLSPLKDERRIVVRDPQRMVQLDARAVDGWAEENCFQVLICTGNFSFRIWYERIKHETSVNLLLVDQTREPDASRKTAPPPVFYPDLMARTRSPALLSLTLRDFLVETTGDNRWPPMVNERNLARLMLDRLDGVLTAHEQLRRVHDERFSDSDLHKIVLGAMLGLDPFRKPSPLEVRRLCAEQHAQLEEARLLLPTEATESFLEAIGKSEAPFCWFLKFDHELVMRAFTLSLLLHQYETVAAPAGDGTGLRLPLTDPHLLLANFDAQLAPLRDINAATLEQAGREFLEGDPDRLAEDINKLELFLQEDADRIKLLCADLLKLHDRSAAILVLKTEKLSPLIRSIALAGLLADLLANRNPSQHREPLAFLEEEETKIDKRTELLAPKKGPLPLALRRPSEDWARLKETYRLAHRTLELAKLAHEEARRLQVASPESLDYERFSKAWCEDGLAKLDFYLSDIARTLRLEQAKPLRDQLLWDAFRRLWEKARDRFEALQTEVRKDLDCFQGKFQDLYAANYTHWIHDPHAPIIFTHQFVTRFLKPHVESNPGRKAYLLIFDGMRFEAWQELLAPLFLERFDLIEERAGSAIIPTETNLSRKAISAGCLPAEFRSTKENELLQTAWRKHLGYDLHLAVEKDEDDAATGIAVRYTSPELDVVIFGFTDKNLHGNSQDLSFIYRNTVKAIIAQDVRSVIRQIPDDALIFVVSDHGLIPSGSGRLRISEDDILDNRDVTHLVARLQHELVGRCKHDAVQFAAADLGIPVNQHGYAIANVAFPRPGLTFQRPKYPTEPDRYLHGGLSPAECFIPMICLGPKRDRLLPVSIESWSVQGSLLEGEDVTLVLAVAGNPRDVKLLIDVDRAGIQGRTELFQGGKRTYRLSWRLPRLDQPTPEELANAAVAYPVSVTLRYQYEGKSYRTSATQQVRILLDRQRLRRPGTSKLDAVLGMMPKKG